MDLGKIIRKLHEERAKLNRIIDSLEQLQKSPAVLEAKALKKRRGRKSMDEAARREVSERMRRYWSEQRRKKAQDPPAPKNST